MHTDIAFSNVALRPETILRTVRDGEKRTATSA